MKKESWLVFVVIVFAVFGFYFDEVMMAPVPIQVPSGVKPVGGNPGVLEPGMVFPGRKTGPDQFVVPWGIYGNCGTPFYLSGENGGFKQICECRESMFDREGPPFICEKILDCVSSTDCRNGGDPCRCEAIAVMR